jgi:predicted TIM-barrel fold metal-dependent hydrolase
LGWWGGGAPPPPRDRVDEARRCIEEHGFPGIAVDPGWMDVPLMADAPELFPLYAYCEQAQIPVAITMSVLVGPEIEHSHPRSVHNIAAAFPDLTIVVVHSAWPWVMEVLGVAFRHPNVWVLPDFYLNIPQMPGFELFLDAARSYLGDRLLYASSYPSRPLGQSADEFRRLGLDDPLRERCMVSNLNRLLGVGVTA